MACSYPISINTGTERAPKWELVPCGKCINCIQRKRSDWSFRLLQEHKIANSSTFLTLTYDEKHIPKNFQLDKKELQKYFKRVRTQNRKLKYYAVGEYGAQTLRPHYHAIVFNCDNNTLVNQWSEPGTANRDVKGFVSCDTVTEASIHYVTGYVVQKYGEIDEKTGKSIDKYDKPITKVNEETGEIWTIDQIRPFALMSKGLGKIYLKYNTKFHKSNMSTETTKEGGQKQLLPRYYRDKIFTSEKDPWLEKLGLVEFTEKERLQLINQIKQRNQKINIDEEFIKRKTKKLKVKHFTKLKKL